MRRLEPREPKASEPARRRLLPRPRFLWSAAAAVVGCGAVLAALTAPLLLTARSNPGARPAPGAAGIGLQPGTALAQAPTLVGLPSSRDEGSAPTTRDDGSEAPDNGRLQVVKLKPVVVALSAEDSQPAGPAHPVDPPGAHQAQGGVGHAQSATARAARRHESLKQSIQQEILEIHQILPELKATDVKRIVEAQRPRLQQCYVRALRFLGTSRDVHVELTVDIAPTGAVQAASVDGDSLPTLAPCLNGVAQQWRFPASREGATVPIPLSFTAKP